MVGGLLKVIIEWPVGWLLGSASSIYGGVGHAVANDAFHHADIRTAGSVAGRMCGGGGWGVVVDGGAVAGGGGSGVAARCDAHAAGVAGFGAGGAVGSVDDGADAGC